MDIKKIRRLTRFLVLGAFKKSATDFETLLLPKISQLIISELSAQCASHLKHVIDIPRLYRRTNKDAPTKPFAYVSQLLSALEEFRTRHIDRTESLQQWTDGVIKALSTQLSILFFYAFPFPVLNAALIYISGI